MAKEIERKFLLEKGTSIPIPEQHYKLNIKQGYIHVEKDKQIRVRVYKNKGVICLKYTKNQIRDEFEYDIPLKDAKEIYNKCKWKLEKKRISFTVGSENYDIDLFPNGMVYVEVEYKSIKAMNKWVKPKWIDKEISNKPKYSNIRLAKKKLSFSL